MFDQIIAGYSRFQCYYLGMLAAGFVLVGGKSTRMGRDKALLPFRSKPLVQSVAETVAAITGTVTLVGAADRYRHLPLPVLSDLHPDCGPLGGIEAALASSSAADLNVVVACDLPDLASAVLRRLVERACISKSLCIAARDAQGQAHPLCAVYKRACLPVIRACRKNQMLRLTRVLDLLDAHYFPVDETIVNVNTPEEWSAWQRNR